MRRVCNQKTVAMIPILLGSQRIPDKNLLLVDGYPLCYYAVKACKAAGVFDEIYINSEHDQFASIAKMLGVKFYRRDPAKGGTACTMSTKSRDCGGGRCQVHDHYIAPFLEDVPCEYLVQVHTTSPLIKPTTINAFVNQLTGLSYGSLFAVREIHEETFYNGEPLNFNPGVKTPTQDLTPVQPISWAISGWRSSEFLEAAARGDGPTFNQDSELFTIGTLEGLDADNWDDLYIIEACLKKARQGGGVGAFKFANNIIEIDKDLQRLIARDGVPKQKIEEAQNALRNLDDLKERMGEPPWSYSLVYTETDQACIICQKPGEGCRKHYHVTKSEWWIVLEGQFEWKVDEGRVIVANKGDVVLLPKGAIHTITCTSETPGIRLACGARDMEHIYVGG